VTHLHKLMLEELQASLTTLKKLYAGTRVHRNHVRPRPNGFTGRAQNSSPPLTLHPRTRIR
jgi:hypothetical protein